MFDSDPYRQYGWRPANGFVAPNDGVDLWMVPVPQRADVVDALHWRLSAAERARALDKRVDSKRREYVTGQATMRTLLARALDVEPGRVAYRRGPKGKPYLAPPLDASGLQFNITHSGDLIVLALARGREVGVDVEWINDRTDCERVARRTFTVAERASMERLAGEHRRAHFFRVWTCKEAVVKCTGLGIHSGMAHFEIEGDAHGDARIARAWDRQAGVERLALVPLALGPRHAGALVHEPPATTVRRFLLDGDPDPLAVL